MKRVLLALVALLVISACSGAESATPTSVPVVPSSTTSTTTAVGGSPEPTTTTTTLAEASTSEGQVTDPDEVETYHMAVSVDGVVSEPGVSDQQFTYYLRGDIGPNSFSVVDAELFGFEVLGDRTLMSVDSVVYEKTEMKPWIVADSFVEVDVTRLSFDGFDKIYDLIADLDGTGETVDGIETVRYDIEMDDYVGLRSIDFVPSRLKSISRGADDLSSTAWIDAETGLLVRFELDAAGSLELLDPFFIYFLNDAATADMTVVVEFSEFNSIDPSVGLPADAEPFDGDYLLFRDSAFGYEVELPIDWVVFPYDPFPGYEVPLYTVPSLFEVDDISFSVSIESLRALGRVTVEEYAEVNIDAYLFGTEEMTIRESESIEFLGFPAHRIVADVVDGDLTYTIHSVVIIDGSDAWAIDFLGYSGFYETTEEERQRLYDTFNLFEPEPGSA